MHWQWWAGIPALRLLLAGLLGIAHAGAAMASDSIAQQIRERLEATPAHNAIDREIATLYAARDYAPVWQEPGQLRALRAAIDGLRADGLDPVDYPVASFAVASGDASASNEQRADLDLSATGACLLALHHLHWGRIDPRSIDPHYNFAPSEAEQQEWLAGLGHELGHADIGDVFAQARPRHPSYARLAEALHRLREIEAAGGWPVIADGSALKPGAIDPRVVPLRRRLQAGGYLDAGAADGTTFDTDLENALRLFQAEQYLDVDGKIGLRTRAALNVPVEARVDQVRVNLERARWLLRGVQGDFVLVDIAGFKVTYFRAGVRSWSSRAQVGLPYRSTPSFRSEIDAVTFNPTWTVPPTILTKDLLPKIRKNPAVLARNRIRVFDEAGRELAASDVDWRTARGIVLRQDAGVDNSLGRVAIRFPNPYGVYMHDTPHKELFVEEQRAFSSGCIRLERPLELVEQLFADTPGWDRSKMDELIASGETKTIRLAHPVPVLLLYWSVDTHDGERIAFKPDIYAKDAAILRALHRPVEQPTTR